MKKVVGGLLALILAVGASAFTTPKRSAADPVYNWNLYTGSTSNPTITVVQLTDAEAMAADCPNSGFKCLVKLDDQFQETSEIIERGQQ